MKRLIITYNQNCNLKCKFCYIDFHYQKIEDKTNEIVAKAIEYGFDIITFGGGDSFSKKTFRSACKLAKENNIITHVDTNAIAIKDSDIDFINQYVDLLGISLDAIGEDYDKFRDSKNLFKKVDLIIEKLEEKIHIPIKINTIVTRLNSHNISEIGGYIMKFKNIKRWSLYQFFPLSVARKEQDKYEISDYDFDLLTQHLNINNSNLNIEFFKFKDRVDGYLFCDEQGFIYTNSINGSYEKLYSIFDKDFKNKTDNIKRKINPKTIHRYK
jgi:MoaA/NifB/PqqE/SkfB family radical SAM enzyme